MCVLSKAQLRKTTGMYKARELALIASGMSADAAKAQAAVWVQTYRRELLAAKKRRVNK